MKKVVIERIGDYLKHSFCVMLGDIVEIELDGEYRKRYIEVVSIRDETIITHNFLTYAKKDIVSVFRKKGNKFVRQWKKGDKKKLY